MSYLANTQTDRKTNKPWQKHNLLGGGKNAKLGAKNPDFEKKQGQN